MGAVFNSYALERMIEQYYEREGVSARSSFRLFGAFAVSALIAGGVVALISTVLSAWLG